MNDTDTQSDISEVVAVLSYAGMAEAVISDALTHLSVHVADFDAALALLAGMLRKMTTSGGLSLGDRACLALAQYMDLVVLTADRAWASLQVGVAARLIR